MEKPVISGEVIGECIRWVTRGGWRRRASKDKPRNLGGPLQWWLSTTNIMREYITGYWLQRESEGAIVAKKWSNVHGAKGPC